MSAGWVVEVSDDNTILLTEPSDDVMIEVPGEGAPLIHVGTTPPDPSASPLWLDIS